MFWVTAFALAGVGLILVSLGEKAETLKGSAVFFLSGIVFLLASVIIWLIIR